MLPLLRCAAVIGTIYLLSPERDPLPAAPVQEAVGRAEAAEKAWASLPEAARRAIVEEASRRALEGARAAVAPPPRPERPPGARPAP